MSNKQQIKNLVVIEQEFTGTVYLDGVEFDVTGEFDLKWRGQYPEIKSIGLTVHSENGVEAIIVERNTVMIDMALLEEQILATDDGSWYDDVLCADNDENYHS